MILVYWLIANIPYNGGNWDQEEVGVATWELLCLEFFLSSLLRKGLEWFRLGLTTWLERH